MASKPDTRKGYRAGPVFHDRDENRTVPPESEVLLSANSPLQYPGIDFPGEAEECDPPVVVCLARGTVPDHHVMLQRRVNQDSPTTSRHLRHSSFLTTSVTSAWVMDESTSEPSDSASSVELGVGGIEEILEVFLPLSEYIPS